MGATNPKSWAMRFHTQTAGSTLTAQQPQTNIVRTTMQALAAVLGGTQSLHTNSFDEALGLPTEQSAKIALRTQQILGYESGIADTIDPLAGSYFVEALTDSLEEQAMSLLDEIDALGGAVRAIEAGFQQNHIEQAAYETARRMDSDEQVVVGVNRFTEDGESDVPVMSIDAELEPAQVQRLSESRSRRDAAAVGSALALVTATAGGNDNLLPPMKTALELGATLGEVSDALRAVFGDYRP